MAKLISMVSCVALVGVMGGCGVQTSLAPSGSKQVRVGDATSSVTVAIAPGAAGKGPTAYGNNPLKIKPGTMVTWTNNDTVAHSATSDDGLWDSNTIPPGQSFAYTFNAPGSFRYHSTNDGPQSMSGAIQVMADSDDDGVSVGNPRPTIVPEPLHPHRRCQDLDRDGDRNGDWDRDQDCDDGQQQQQVKPKPKPTPKPKPIPTKPTPKPTKPSMSGSYSGSYSGGYSGSASGTYSGSASGTYSGSGSGNYTGNGQNGYSGSGY